MSVSNLIFGAVAEEYYDRGLAPIPLGLHTDGEQAKSAKITKWQNLARDRYDRSELDRLAKHFGPNNVGIAMGSFVGEEHQLVAIDIDLDDFQEKIERAMPALVSGKVGAKGASWFALAPKEWKSIRATKSAPTPENPKKRISAFEILAIGTQTAIPPSIHPSTQQPYRWLKTPLLDMDFKDLPRLNEGFRLELRAILEGKDTVYNGGTIKDGTPDAQETSGINFMTWMGNGGGGNTHDERCRAAGFMVATGWTIEDAVARLNRAMKEAGERNPQAPPMDMNIVERDNRQFVQSAFDKGFDKQSKPSKKEKSIPPERVYANWAIKEFEPLVHTGMEFRRYQEGHWPVFNPDEIEKRIYYQDPAVTRNDVTNAVKIAARLSLTPRYFAESKPAICLMDGTLDIFDMNLRPWREDDRLLHQLNFNWNEEIECTNYMKVVTQAFAGCEDSIRTYEEFCGLTLINEMKFQKALFIVGMGGSGKSTMANILESMHSPEAVGSVPLTELHDIRLRTMLVGKLVNISSEQSRMNMVSDVQFKQITGGDFVTVRSLYEEAESVRMSVRFLGVQNEFPQTSDVSYAMQRRMIILQTPNKVESPDPDMGAKLYNERPAILRRWVAALNNLMARGRFDPPASSSMLVQEYILDNSPVQMWLTEICSVDPSHKGDLNDLYMDFAEWAKMNGYQRPITKNFFRKKLLELGHKPTTVKMPQSKGSNVYHIIEQWPIKRHGISGPKVDSRV